MFNGRVEEFWGDAQWTGKEPFHWIGTRTQFLGEEASETPLETCTAAAQPLLSICIYNTPPLTYIKVSFSLFPWCFIQLWDIVEKYNKSVIIPHIHQWKKPLPFFKNVFLLALQRVNTFSALGKEKERKLHSDRDAHMCTCSREPD